MKPVVSEGQDWVTRAANMVGRLDLHPLEYLLHDRELRWEFLVLVNLDLDAHPLRAFLRHVADILLERALPVLYFEDILPEVSNDVEHLHIEAYAGGWRRPFVGVSASSTHGPSCVPGWGAAAGLAAMCSPGAAGARAAISFVFLSSPSSLFPDWAVSYGPRGANASPERSTCKPSRRLLNRGEGDDAGNLTCGGAGRARRKVHDLEACVVCNAPR